MTCQKIRNNKVVAKMCKHCTRCYRYVYTSRNVITRLPIGRHDLWKEGGDRCAATDKFLRSFARRLQYSVSYMSVVTTDLNRHVDCFEYHMRYNGIRVNSVLYIFLVLTRLYWVSHMLLAISLHEHTVNTSSWPPYFVSNKSYDILLHLFIPW